MTSSPRRLELCGVGNSLTNGSSHRRKPVSSNQYKMKACWIPVCTGMTASSANSPREPDLLFLPQGIPFHPVNPENPVNPVHSPLTSNRLKA
jgi:hypothetical protein